MFEMSPRPSWLRAVCPQRTMRGSKSGTQYSVVRRETVRTDARLPRANVTSNSMPPLFCVVYDVSKASTNGPGSVWLPSPSPRARTARGVTQAFSVIR